MHMKKYSALFIFPLLFGCIQDGRNTDALTGYVPVYQPTATAHDIAVQSAKATVNAGKIYAYKNYLFQVEQGKGIHIIDNTTPQQANKIAFISVPGCSEMAIKANFLYTNNVNDLVVLSLDNITAPTLVSRQENAFPQIDQTYPPFQGVYFECTDPSKGVVIGWEQKILENPKCRR